MGVNYTPMNINLWLLIKNTLVQERKRMMDWRWGERLGNDLEGNKKDVLERGKASEER